MGRDVKNIGKADVSRGFFLIEVAISVAVIAIILVGFTVGVRRIYRLSEDTAREVRAIFLAEEAIEIVRVLRDSSWDEISGMTQGVPYYLVFENGNWGATTSATTTLDIYSRWVNVNPVYRDGSDDIAQTGTIDPDTIRASVTVSWPKVNQETKTISLDTYITNFF